MSAHRLNRETAALLVVDIQERLAAAMPGEALARVVQRTRAAIHGARAMGLPTVATEQYPKGLGPTLPATGEALGDASRIEKIRFSAALPEVLTAIPGRRQVLITGMETHVCVFQTVRDLAESGAQVFVCADAVLSRTSLDREVGLGLCREAGAVITTVEAALFDLLGQAGTPEFKQVSAAVK